MAKRKPVCIDGETIEVKTVDTLADILPKDVPSVVTHAGKMVPRSEFSSVPVPEHFDTNLSTINKG